MTTFFPLLFSVLAPMLGVHEFDAHELPAQAAEDGIVRTYDVSSLVVDPQFPRERYFKLAAYLSLRSYDELEPESSIDEQRGVDEVVSLLLDLLGKEFEYEGRNITAVEYGRILVRGPEGLHKRVADVLIFLDELVNAQAELTVNLLALDPGAEHPFGGRVMVARDEAERWLAAAAGVTEQQELHLALRSDRPAEIDLTRTMPLLLDYDVEIAQASTISDPIVNQASIGTRVFVYAVPDPVGVALSFVLGRGDVIGEVRERTLRLNGQVRTDTGLVDVPSGNVFQTLDILARGIGFDVVLAKDQALVLHHRIDLGRDRRNELIVLRLTGGELPHRRDFRYGPQGEDLIAVDLDFFAPPSLRASGSLLDEARLPFKLMEWISGGTVAGILGVSFEEHSPEYGIALIDANTDVLGMTSLGHYQLIRPYDNGAGDPNVARTELAKVRTALDGLKGEAGTIEVSVKLSRLGKWAGVPIEATVPVRLEHSSCLALGIENPIVMDFDVEVAQESSTADATVFSEFEGLVLWLHASRSPRGDLVLDVSAGASQSIAPRETLDIGSRDLERSTQDQLFSRQRLTFRKDQAGPWRAVLGDSASGKGSESSLRLELSVAR